jgi:hypothetical protein
VFALQVLHARLLHLMGVILAHNCAAKLFVEAQRLVT